jgi:PAS domain S-box-containing protein
MSQPHGSRGDASPRRGAGAVPRSIERKLAWGARQSERAIVVGSRSGVIEWANDAWTRVTGYPLHESISKPVQGFLDGVEIDRGVVDFVARCFQEGRACEFEIPLTPPNRSELWIALRVEPLFDADGQPSDFIATATDVSERKRSEGRARLVEVDLSALAARVAARHREKLAFTVDVDLALDESLPLVLADPEKVESLVERRVANALEAIGDAWGTITVWTGILGVSEGPLYAENLWRTLPPGQWAFLEVHDTGGRPGGVARAAVREPFLSARFPGHAVRFVEAEECLRAQGAEVRLESSLPDGTSVVFLFPYANEDSGWYRG